MRALIVDDSSFVREYMQQMLEQMSVGCEQAGNGQEALDRLKTADPFDLMFCDINMPVMDGLACVKRLRDEGLYPRMLVMMVTTETDHEAIVRALKYGADEFLMKPFTLQVLKDKLLLMGMGVHQ